MYQNIIKPFLDISVAFAILLVLSPVIIIVSIILYLSNKDTPFFLQHRPGKNETIFTIVKFKTMNDKKDSQGNLLPDAERITPIGNFIRSSSLDELPQLLNVLKGDMSFVGPRPLLPEYLIHYNTFQSQRHNVKPGITGWAQVNGRNAISWPKKFEYDVWYIENQSFLLDIKILIFTVKKIFKNADVSADGHVTMPSFIEYKKNEI